MCDILQQTNDENRKTDPYISVYVFKLSRLYTKFHKHERTSDEIMWNILQNLCSYSRYIFVNIQQDEKYQ